MKKLYLLLLFIPVFARAQSNHKSKDFYEKEIRELSSTEMKSHEKHVLASMSMDSFTVASHNFDVHFYRCEWKVDPSIQYINGIVTSFFKIKSAANAIIYDLNRALTVDSVLYHGLKISFLQTIDNGLTIQFPSTLSSGQNDSVSIFYQGVPDPSGFGAFTRSTHAGTPVMWTLSEPYGAREWWPCKNGLTDKADSIDIIITHPVAYTASSNGMLITESISGPDKIAHYQHRYPIASYLVAFAVSNYQVSTDTLILNGNPMLYKGYYYPELYADWKNFEQYAKRFLQLFSTLYGEYPFAKEKYAQTAFNWGGGMEHQTNSFIQHRGPNLQAHELMHQWFGDKVTCGSWRDLWLNEGFATYGTALTLEYIYPQFHRDYMESMYYWILTDSAGSVYVNDTANIGRLFDGRLTYYKGAYAVHMLRWKVGDSAFYRGVRRYLADPAVSYGFAKTADLKRNLELESGKDLTTFFDKWIYGEGYANYNAEWSQNTNNWAKVKLMQTTSHPSVSFYDMPVPLQFSNATRDTIIVVDHKYSGQQFWVNVGFVADTMIIDPDIWLLANEKFTTKLPASTVKDQLKLYPNPSSDNLFIQIDNPSDTKMNMQLYNALGQLLYIREVNLAGRDEVLAIPLRKFSRGVYWLKLKGDKKLSSVQKVIKR
ncbi:MAG TPA: M1 family aminopeptidase [Flavitalea sp.]|nr:M1 family aminopeptidase [Flavitalea sp.]